MHLGVVGTDDSVWDVVDFVQDRTEAIVSVDARNGWEQVTLDRLHWDNCYDYVLYAHTKGVSTGSGNQWRQLMTQAVVTECCKITRQSVAIG